MTRQRSRPAKGVSALRSEEREIQRRLRDVRETIERLNALTGSKRHSLRSKPSSKRLSAEGREAISRAAKKRWAAYRRKKRAQS